MLWTSLCLALWPLAARAQTDAFEFSWPSDTDQCGVSLETVMVCMVTDPPSGVRLDMARRLATIQSVLCVSRTKHPNDRQSC